MNDQGISVWRNSIQETTNSQSMLLGRKSMRGQAPHSAIGGYSTFVIRGVCKSKSEDRAPPIPKRGYVAWVGDRYDRGRGRWEKPNGFLFAMEGNRADGHYIALVTRIPRAICCARWDRCNTVLRCRLACLMEWPSSPLKRSISPSNRAISPSCQSRAFSSSSTEERSGSRAA